MKKVSFLSFGLIAMLALLASCIDDDTKGKTYTVNSIVIVEGSTWLDYSGIYVTPTDNTYKTLVSDGVYAMSFSYQTDNYDSDGNLYITMLADPEDLGNGNITSDEPLQNIPLYQLSVQPSYVPYMLMQRYLMVPIMAYFTEADDNYIPSTTDWNKHTFALYHNPDEDTSRSMTLYVVDYVSDPTTSRTEVGRKWQAFDIGQLITNFAAKGGTLETIYVKANVNPTAASLADADEVTYIVQ